jgi:chaperonin GroES
LFAFARWIGTLGIWGWSGAEVKIDGVEYLIMKESDIMRVLVEVEAKKKAA